MATPTLPTLPTWTDAHSVSLFIVAAFSLVVTVLSLFHVAVPRGVAEDVGTLSGLAGAIIALGVNAWTHRTAHAKAFAATATVLPGALIPKN